jgi:hypothetical protein
MAEKIVPNSYDLQGTGVSINYSTSSIAGNPQLTYKKGRQTLNFSGDEIGVLDTQLGKLITVTIAKTVDRGFTSFSFLLPTIELAAASSKQSFRTIGITTVHKTTIGGPVKGAQQTYKSIELSGVARSVAFLTQKTVSA